MNCSAMFGELEGLHDPFGFGAAGWDQGVKLSQ
jgi:hypothetical protein